MPPPDHPIRIRPLIPADLPAALAIQQQSYPAFLLEDEPAFLSRLEIAASYSLAATRDGALIAYLLAHGWTSAAPPPVGTVLPRHAASEVLFIHDLAVAAAGRGSGIGARLVSTALDLAIADRLPTAELIAVEGAADYWRAQGFSEATCSPQLAAKVASYGPAARWMTRTIAPETGPVA